MFLDRRHRSITCSFERGGVECTAESHGVRSGGARNVEKGVPSLWLLGMLLIVLACFIYKRDSSGDKEVTMTKVFGIVRFLGDIVFGARRSYVSVV